METYFTKTCKKPARDLEFLLKIDHPNIVHTISLEETDKGDTLITMEDVGKTTLKDLAGEEGGLSAEDVIYIGKKLCSAISYLHSLTPPWLYCDMKPENVIITKAAKDIKRVVLIDIDGGCPMVMDGLAPKDSFGTKGYAAPEQMAPMGSLDFRVDVYGICATLDAVYKRRLFFMGSRGRALTAIIKKGMSEDPGDRYFTVKELEKAINKAGDQK